MCLLFTSQSMYTNLCLCKKETNKQRNQPHKNNLSSIEDRDDDIVECWVFTVAVEEPIWFISIIPVSCTFVLCRHLCVRTPKMLKLSRSTTIGIIVAIKKSWSDYSSIIKADLLIQTLP